jgi:hypothetical protein
MRTSLLVGFLLVGLVACGDDAPTPIEDVPAVYASAFCEQADACLGPLFDALFPGDCDVELRKQLEEGTIPLFEAGIASGTIVYHGEEVDACRDELRRSGCAIFDNGALPACERVFEGTVAIGGACSSAEECVGDGTCAIDAMCPGSCVARGGAGSDCVSESQCARGLVCNGGACSDPLTLGQPCEGDCATGLACIDGFCASISAVLDGALGDDCDGENFDLCDDGLHCAAIGLAGDAVDWECVATYPAGGTCQIAIPEGCPSGQRCDADPETTFMFDGTCVPLPDEGEPCEEGILSASCQPGLVCVGTCERQQHIGGACETDEYCYSNTCTAGFCAEPTCEE